MQLPPSPFKILALAPLAFNHTAPWAEAPRPVDKADFDACVKALAGSLYVSLPSELCPAGGLEVHCEMLKDFHPDGLAQKTPYLKDLLAAAQAVREHARQGASPKALADLLGQWPSLPRVSIPASEKPQKSEASSAVDNILKMVAMPEDTPSSSSDTNTVVSQLEGYLRQALGRVFSTTLLREVEAAWQGLKVLVEQGHVDGKVKVEVVPVTEDTLEQTLENLLVTLIQEPPSLVLVDLGFTNSPRHLELLEHVARFAQTLLSPTICWVTHAFFHLSSWDELHKLAYLPHHLDGPPFAKWRALAQSPAAPWLAVTCNRFLARYPYGPDNSPRLAPFVETSPLWISPVWALGALIAQSHAKTGWPTRWTHWQQIRLEDLALDVRDPAKPIATELAIPENRTDQFADAGMMPLIGFRNKDIAFVLHDTTIAKNALSYQLLMSRITHFVLWCKDNLDKKLPLQALEENLRQALSLFWQASGAPNPEHLEVRVSEKNAEGRIPVSVSLTAPRATLPTGQPVELGFYW